jgi:hypothetical protein
MIQVRRAAESDSFVFEVVVCEGNGETHHHVTRKDVRATDVRLAYPGALSRAGLPVLARPGAKGINPATLRHRGDFALFPRLRAGKATLPFAVLIKVQAARSRLPHGLAHFRRPPQAGAAIEPDSCARTRQTPSPQRLQDAGGDGPL